VETIVARKEFPTITDALAAQCAESYIDGQPNGAGTWPDGAVVTAPALRGGRLVVRDVIGTDRGGPMRHIELQRGQLVVVTFVYSHFLKQLVRTF